MAQPSTKVPGWASFFTDEEYAAFSAAVDGELGSRGLVRCAECGGSVPLEGSGSLGLVNLARLCHQAEPGEYGDIVRRQIATMLRGPAVEATPFAQLAPLLKARLFHQRHMGVIRSLTRAVSDDLFAVLALDLPEHVVTVSLDQVAAWGRPEGELFDLALSNLRGEPRLDAESIEIEPDVAVMVLSGESFFTTSHVLLLDEYAPDAGHGVLVTLSDRHAIAVHSIADARALKVLGPMLSLADTRFREQPGPLSPSLYWRRGPILTRIPCGIRPDGQPWVAPPDAFNEMVAVLHARAQRQ